MIEHYLPNNNENVIVLILQNFLHLNKPYVTSIVCSDSGEGDIKKHHFL